MSIAVYLPPQLRARLGQFIDPRHAVVAAASWSELTTIVQQQHVDLLLVDPAVHGEADLERMIWLLKEFPSIPVVAYTVMTHATVGVVYELTKRGLHRVMLYGFDDTPARLALLLDGIPRQRFLPLILNALQIESTTLPPIVQERVRDLFENPTSVQSVAEFARSVSVSRPRLYVLFHEAGLGPPGRLLIGARLAQACAYLRDPGHSVSAVATKIGWSDSRTLKRYLQRAFGIQVPHLRRYDRIDDLVERLLHWMRAGWQ